MSTHHLEEISSGCGDRVSLSVRWNSARFIVNLDPSPGGNMMEDSLIKQYNAACDAEDYDEEEAMTDQILDAIVEAGRPTFDRLAPPPAPGTSTSTDLHALLFPKECSFRLRTLNGRTELTLMDYGAAGDTAPQHGWSPDLSEQQRPFHLRVDDDDTTLPRFSTKDISVLQKLIGDGYIAMLRWGAKKCVPKLGTTCERIRYRGNLTAS